MNLSTKELKAIAKTRGIKGYKSMSEDELLSVLTLSKPVKKGKNLTELEKNLFKTKKYYNYDDIEYKGIINVRDLFNLSIDEDYYKPIIARGAFNSSYIQYESRGNKGKNLSIKEYLNMIKPYLSDIINYHKTHGLVRYHSDNKTWVEETSSKWKIQLTMAINFISCKDSDETRTMHTKIFNVEIMMGSKTDEIIKDLFESFLQKYEVILFMIVLMHCIILLIK